MSHLRFWCTDQVSRTPSVKQLSIDLELQYWDQQVSHRSIFVSWTMSLRNPGTQQRHAHSKQEFQFSIIIVVAFTNTTCHCYMPYAVDIKNLYMTLSCTVVICHCHLQFLYAIVIWHCHVTLSYAIATDIQSPWVIDWDNVNSIVVVYDTCKQKT